MSERPKETKYIVAVWDFEAIEMPPVPVMAASCETLKDAVDTKDILHHLIGTLSSEPDWGVGYFPVSLNATPADPEAFAEEFFAMARNEGETP